jgi:hypothetical protein
MSAHTEKGFGVRRRKPEEGSEDLKAKLRRQMDAAVSVVGSWLHGVLRGWYQYYAVPGNYARLRQFRDAV